MLPARVCEVVNDDNLLRVSTQIPTGNIVVVLPVGKRHQPPVRESACQTTEPSLERVAAQDRPWLEIDQTEMNDSDERGWVGEAGGQIGRGKELDHASASYPAANRGVAVPVRRSISNSRGSSSSGSAMLGEGVRRAGVGCAVGGMLGV